MTLPLIKPKYNDLQNRPLVVLCAFLISIIGYGIVEYKIEVARNVKEERKLQTSIDSMNRGQLIFWRDMALKDDLIYQQSRTIEKTDSLLKGKTIKPMLKILNAEK